MTTPVEQLSQVIDATEALVAGVGEDQWPAPTPCTEWNVRDLVDHMVAGNRRFTSILGGEAPSFAADDLLSDNPGAAYRTATDAAVHERIAEQFALAGQVPNTVRCWTAKARPGHRMPSLPGTRTTSPAASSGSRTPVSPNSSRPVT